MTDLLAKLRAALAPGPAFESGGPLASARWLAGVTRYFLRRFHDNNIMALSAALSFRTIFALIPILVLAFLSARSLGVVEDGKNSLRQFLDASGFSQIAALREPAAAPPSAEPTPPMETAASAPGAPPGTPPDAAPAATQDTTPAATVPADAEVVNLADQIEQIVAQVEAKLTFDRIGPIGAILLIYTALTLLMTMERSLNRVFGAPNDRPFTRSLLLYWAAVTFGPLVVSVAAYLGRRGLAAVEQSHFAAGPLEILVAVVSFAGPAAAGIIVLSLIYDRLSTAVVPYRAALAGAVVAVLLWLAAKWGFSIYVQQFVLQGNLYGVLGVIPLFLLWLNFSWLIFLFGAEVAHVLADPGQLRQLHDADPTLIGPSDFLAALASVARRFHDGRGPASQNEIGFELNLSTQATRRVLHALEERGYLTHGTNSDVPRYTLARAPERIAVADVLALGDPRRPGRDTPPADPSQPRSATLADHLAKPTES